MPKMTINVFFVKWYKGIINFQILFISSKYHEFWLSYEWFSCLNYQSLPKKRPFPATTAVDWWKEFFVILDNFLPIYSPKNPKNQNFEKMKKNTWRYYHFTNVYHKLQSYVWFLRYWGQQTEFLSIWTIFCPFTP